MTQKITERTYASGSRVATVRLKPGERVQIVREGEHASVVNENHFYRLGGQVSDIVQGHVISEMRRVYWCSITQEWEQA